MRKKPVSLSLLISAMFFAAETSAANELHFPTHLDQPKMVLVSRDPVNYRFSNDIASVLEKINAGRRQLNKIALLTVGKNFSQDEFDRRQNALEPAKKLVIPKLPREEISQLNVKETPWSHLDTVTDFWMQDFFEFFYRAGKLSLFSFKAMFTAVNMSELIPLSDDEFNHSLSEEEKQIYLKKLEASLNEGEIKAAKVTKNFNQMLSLSIPTESAPGLSAQGGNFEPYPHDVIVTGIRELGPLKEYLRNSKYENRIIEIDTAWLHVGHIDEVFSYVPNVSSSCGITLFYPDTKLGLDLLKNEKTPAASLIPDAYKNLGVMSGYEFSGLFELHQSLRQGLAGPSIPTEDSAVGKNLRDMLEIDQRIQNSVQAFEKAYKALVPSCQTLPKIALPALFHCSGFDEAISGCQAMLANPANSLSLEKHLLVGEPFIPAFRDEIRSRFNAVGITTHFIDSTAYHFNAGEVHCGTNVVREKTVNSHLQ